MLKFRVHEFALEEGRRSFMLLPKMNAAQMAKVRQRLAFLGFRTSGGSPMRAAKGDWLAGVSPAGFCWSSRNLADLVGPALPGILATPKEPRPKDFVRGLYFDRGQEPGLFRVKPRMESSVLWRELRAKGECALSPDERAVFGGLLSRTGGTCTVVTDYPNDTSRVRIFGRRQYYESTVETAEAAENLREAGTTRPRNVYLPQDGLISISGGRRGGARILPDLGEWCFFSPTPAQKL